MKEPKTDSCKYCNNEKDHIISKGSTMEVYISEGWVTAFCGWCGMQTDVKINYCPMCGRKFEW